MSFMNISPVLSVKNLEKSKVSFSLQKGFQIDHEGKNTTASQQEEDVGRQFVITINIS